MSGDRHPTGRPQQLSPEGDPCAIVAVIVQVDLRSVSDIDVRDRNAYLSPIQIRRG